MNPFVSRINKSSWEIPVSALCLLLGFMVSMVWRPSSAHGLLRFSDADQKARVESLATATQDASQNQNSKLAMQVNHLQDENTRLQNALAKESNQGNVLNQSLQETKLFAALTEVSGPGITVTLRDSNKSVPNVAPTDAIIHDTDVLKVVNELWAAGAEAIAVNNHRVSLGTSFRCVGPVILVDGSRIASPVVIRAIGDPDTLLGAMNLPGGALDEMRRGFDPAMAQLEKVRKHILPAYTGTTTHALMSVHEGAK